MPPPRPVLVLASRSPRRAQLLRNAGYAFVQAEPPFADPAQPAAAAGDVRRLTRALAARKAMSLGNAGAPGPRRGRLILAADTACVAGDGRVVGQPADRGEAEAILRSFLGRTHRVVTGIALLGAGDQRPRTLSDAAEVTMGRIEEHALRAYLDSGEWRGKAGAYNLFDRLAAGWPIRVDGDPATVVGLPMRRLAPLLAARGVRRAR